MKKKWPVSDGFGLMEPLRSETISDEKSYFYRSTRRLQDLVMRYQVSNTFNEPNVALSSGS